MLAEFQEADYDLGSLQSTQRAGRSRRPSVNTESRPVSGHIDEI